MSQTYCRPVGDVEILAFCEAGAYQLITIKTANGCCVVCPAVMVYLRGQPVMHEWCGPLHRRLTRDLVSELRGNELIIDAQGEIYVAGDVRRER